MTELVESSPFIPTKDEIGLLLSLRGLKKNSNLQRDDSGETERYRVECSFWYGMTHLYADQVDSFNVVLDCARAGVEMIPRLHQKLSKKATDTDSEHEEGPQSDSETTPENEVAECDDDESEDEPRSWDDVREQDIPSWVRGVTFEVDEQDLTPERRQVLQERFAAVRVQTNAPHLNAAPPAAASSVEKPKGIKNATLELDSVAVENDPMLADKIRSQFPWASISSSRDVGASQSESGNPSARHESAKPSTKKPSSEPPDQGPLSSSGTVARPSPLATPLSSDEPTSRSRNRSAAEHVDGDSRHSYTALTFFTEISGDPDALVTAAKRFGLSIARPRPVWDKFREYRRTLKVPSYLRPSRLDHYYGDLVDMYIIAEKVGIHSLEYALLLKFQGMNYQHSSRIPEIPIVVKAFQYLPVDSPLCRWVTYLYSFLGGTEKLGDYEVFCKTYRDLDPTAVAKLMYEIAKIRDPFTEGHDEAVLQRWCEVHSHASGSDEARLCAETKAANTLSLEEAAESEEIHRQEKAEAWVNKAGGTILIPAKRPTKDEELSKLPKVKAWLNKLGGTVVMSSHAPNLRKRQAESAPASAPRESKRGRGRPRGISKGRILRGSGSRAGSNSRSKSRAQVPTIEDEVLDEDARPDHQSQQNRPAELIDLGSECLSDEGEDSASLSAPPSSSDSSTANRTRAPISIGSSSATGNDEGEESSDAEITNSDLTGQSQRSPTPEEPVVNIGRGSLRSAARMVTHDRNNGEATKTPASMVPDWLSTQEDFSRRTAKARGKERRQASGTYDPNNGTAGRTPASVSSGRISRKENTPVTPRRQTTKSTDRAVDAQSVTPERRSGRTKETPPGYFKLRPARKDFSKTIWRKF